MDGNIALDVCLNHTMKVPYSALPMRSTNESCAIGHYFGSRRHDKASPLTCS